MSENMSFFRMQRIIYKNLPRITLLLCTFCINTTVPAVQRVDVQPSPVATVTKGAVLWLTCTYDLDGGTLGQLRWSKDNKAAATATPTASPQCSTLAPDNYSINCNLTSNEVRLGILNPVHGDTYNCSVYLSDMTLIGPVSTQVSVVVPVPSVTFTSPVSDTVTVTPGGSQVYTCVTGSCRPPARIDWYKDGVNVTTQTGSVSSDVDKFVTASSFTLTGTKGDSQVTIQCRASNMDGMTPVQSGVKTFVVQWPPDGPPVISGYTSASILYADETLLLSCRQRGGNPLPNLTWTGSCGGIPATDGSTVTESVSTITITVTKGYNQETCSCVSTHPQPQTQDKAQVTFTVHYPPSGPVVNRTPTHPWLEGESGTLSCSYTEGFPAPARIEWFRNSLQTEQSAPSITLTLLNKDDNRAGYSCRVRNDFTDVKLTNLTSSATYLNVEYKPLVTLTPTHLAVDEGQTAQLTCDADGNPTPTVEWLRGGTSVQTGQGTSVTLTLSDIDRSATDNYTCRAEGVSSVQGRKLITQRVAYLLVQYPPDVVVVAPPDVEEGDTDIHLMCQTAGEPNMLTSQSWTQTIDQIHIADQFTYETATQHGTIVLAKVSLDDTGTYTCSVSNGIADRQGHTLQSNSTVLNVKVSPKFNSSGQNHNFYSSLHEQVTIKIPFYSNPPVTSTDDLEWTKVSSGARIVPSLNITFGLTKDEIIHLSIKGRTVTFPGQAAVMTLLSFDQSLAGDYTVTVYNNGRRRHSTTTFSITPSGPPEIPTYFQEIETTTTSITVQWTKGFNGGHPQTFVILYRPEGGTKAEKLSVTEQQKSTYTKEIMGLTPNTRYQLNMYAYNEEGNSSLSSVVDIIIETREYLADTGTSMAAIGGGAGGAIVFLLVITAVAVVLYRQRNTGGGKSSSQRADDVLFNPDHNEEGDGMKQNILYESAGPYLPENQQDETAPNKAEYAVVEKKKNIEGAEYAEVIPKKDRKGKTEKAPGNGDVYAEIQKNGKNKKEVEKEKKKVEKGKKKPKKNATKTAVGTVYENVGAVGGKSVKTYTDSADDSKSAPPVAEQQIPSRKKNQDGLVYLDVEFQDSQNESRHAVIHGIENRNEYALVDFTKHAEPLPEGDNVNNDASAKKTRDEK